MAITITKPAVNISERLSNLDGISLENFKAMDATFSSVGIGTTNSPYDLHIKNKSDLPLFIEGTGNPSYMIRYTNNADGAEIFMAKSRGSDIGVHTAVQQNDTVAVFKGRGSDGATGFIDAAAIRIEVDGTVATNDVPGRIVFSTTSQSISGATEKMRIAEDGRLGIRTNAPNVNATVSIDHPNHGVLLGYRDSYPNSGGGLFSTSGAPASYPFDEYGHLILATRTDFGSNYDIIFTTAAVDDTPVERMVVKSQGAIVIGTGPTEVTLVGSKSIADNVATNFLRIVGPPDIIYGHLELTYNLDDPGNQHYVGKYTFRVFHNGTSSFFDTITSDNFSLPPSFAFTFSASGGNFDIAVTTNTIAANYNFGWCAKFVSNNSSNLINI